MKKEPGQRLERMQQLLSEREYRTMAQMDWALSRETLLQSLYGATAAGEIRCISVIGADSRGYMRALNSYALGKPSTKEELQFQVIARRYCAAKCRRECERKERMRRFEGADIRIAAEKQAPTTSLMRIDPMIWRTCGREAPEVQK